MSTISTVAVDFVANTGKYTTGLDGMAKKTKVWSDKTKGEAKGVTSAFDNTTKSISNLAKGLVGLVAIQKVGAAFANAATQVSLLADEAEKVGASAAQFDKLRLAAERNGSDIGTVKIAYKELQKSINEALTGTKASADAFNDLGLSFKSLSELSPDKQFEKIVGALSRVGDANKRVELGTKLLGKSYVELSPLIAKGLGGLESGGRGALNDEQIASIDKVTKSFEEVGRVIDGELRKALVALAPALTTIASGLTFIIENIDKIAIALGVAFSPSIFKKFGTFFKGLNETIAEILPKLLGLREVKKIFGGDLKGLRFGEKELNYFEKLIITSPIAEKALEKVAGGFAYVSKAATVTGVVAAKALAVIGTAAASVEGGFKIGEILADVADGMAATEERLGRGSSGITKFRENLKQYKADVSNVRTFLRQGVLDFFGFDSKAKETKEFLAGSGERIAAATARENERIAEANLAASEKRMREASAEFAKATDAFNKKSSEFNTGLEKSLMTPVEELTGILEELDDAFLFGGLGIETYNRRLAELRKQYDAATAAAAGLIKDTGPSSADQKSFAEAGVRSSFFGVGTVAAPNIQLGDSSNRITDLAERLKGSGAGAKTVFEKQVADINMAAMAVDKYGNAIMSAADKTLALDNATEQYGIASAEAFRKSNEEMFNIVMLTEDFASSLGQAIAAGQSFGEALKNVFQDLTKQIIAMILRSIILQSILAAIGVVSPTGAGAFAAMMNIKPMAAGGPVKGGTPYQVGELGPELFVPEGNGYIVPNNMTGGGGAVVNQTINVQTGVAQTVRAEMLALLPQFRTQAVNAVLETKQRGGSFSKGMTFA